MKTYKTFIQSSKIIFVGLACICWAISGFAQLSNQRTTATKIADLLAVQPADQPERLLNAMTQLEQFTSEDLSALIQQLESSGHSQNSPIKYAIQHYAFHLASKGDKDKLNIFNDGVLNGVEQVSDPAVKRFLLQNLQYTAGDREIPRLTPFLTQDAFAQTAADVLSKIGTAAAGNALVNELASSSNKEIKIALINKLGMLKYAPAEQTILKTLQGTNSKDLGASALNSTIYHALASIGGVESERVLSNAAKKVGYQHEASGVTGALLLYANNRLAQGDRERAKKIALQIHNHKSISSGFKAASLRLLVNAEGDKNYKQLIQAAQSKDDVYRAAAFAIIEEKNLSSVHEALTGMWAKGSESVRISLLNYFGSIQDAKGLAIIKNGLTSNVDAVRAAAILAYYQAKGSEAVSEIVPFLALEGSQTQAAIKQVLLTTTAGNLNALLIKELEGDRPASALVNTLSIIEARHIESARTTVLNLAKQHLDQGVREASFQALSSIASSDQFQDLMALFNAQDRQENKETALKNALIRAVKYSSNSGTYVKQLIAQYEQGDATQKVRILPVFAAIGDDALLQIASNESQTVSGSTLSMASIHALANWSNENAIPYLVQLQRKLSQAPNSSQAETQVQVTRGLIRLIGLSTVPAEQKTILLRDLFDRVDQVEVQTQILRALEATKTYQALRFAGNFLTHDRLKNTAANTVMGIALENPQYNGKEVIDLLEQVSNLLSGSESSYLREAIRKHIASMPKDAGFVSLFNGQDLSGWKGLVANPIKRAAMSSDELAAAQVKADEEMRAGWYVADGELHFNGKGDNIATVKHYRNFEMLVDWKLAADGKDGDAGVYLRGSPQVQIWDTSRVNVGAQVGSGGLYNNQKHPSKPLLVADNALGEWNTFKIIMVDDRVSVYLNGHLVTDNVVLENYWDRTKAIFPMEQIELQAHGTHVSYRDVYIKELPETGNFELSAEEKAEGFEVLFDGSSMDKWTGNTKDYVITEEKTLAVFPKEGSGGNLYTKEEYGDFSFRFSFRLTPGANNGVGIRTPMEGDAAYVGMEIQVLDDGAEIYKNLKDWQYHGSVYGIIAAKTGHLKPVGEWNEEEIYIKGDHIRVTLNGVVIVDGNLKEATKNGTLDGKNHPGLKETKGHIGFLGHGSEVHFKNIRIKKL